MKKCPHCKAEIEETSRFCLYCMSSLDEKQPVSPPKRKSFLFIAAAAILLGLILGLCCCVGSGMFRDTPPQKEESLTPDEVEMQNIPPSSTETTQDTEAGSENVGISSEPPVTGETHTDALVLPSAEKPEPSAVSTDPGVQETLQQPTQTEPTKPVTSQQPVQTEPTEPMTTQQSSQTRPTEPAKPVVTACPHQYQITVTRSASCTAEGSNTYTCSRCGHSYQDTVPAIGHSYQAPTCLLPQVCTVCNTIGAAALGHSYQNGTCSRCGKADPSDPQMIYEYREARAGDQLTYGTWDPQTDIVITGVKQIAADGVYEIPSYIGGKRVVGILPLAFSDTDARSVTLGETIFCVSQNAFSGCYNIEALYIRSDALYLSRSAFIPASSRNCTMKIYCSARCTVNDALNGECYLKDIIRVYGGEFHEWNG